MSIVILAATLLLGLLTWANRSWSKTLLYPPALFAGIWFVSLVGLILSGDWFYPISAETLGIYAIGAVAFSVGGAVAASVPGRVALARRASPIATSPITLRLLDIALLMTAVGLPCFWRSATAGNDATDPALFFASQRLADVEMSADSERSFSLLRNLVVLSQFVALAMFHEDNGTLTRRLRTALAVLLALLYGAITGAKIHAMTLAASLVFLSALRARKLNWFAIVVTALVSLTVFCVGLLAINLTYLDAPFSAEGGLLALRSSLDYWLGGVVGFEQVVQNSQRIEATQSIARVFLETANGLGAHFSIPSLHASYVDVSPMVQTNVYTMYFTYLPDFGLGGVVVALASIGAITTWFYRRAREHRTIALLMYSRLCTGILLSVFAENFVLLLNMYAKLFVFLWALYEVGPRAIVRLSSARGLVKSGSMT